jgi:hypothetical protein
LTITYHGCPAFTLQVIANDSEQADIEKAATQNNAAAALPGVNLCHNETR